MLDYYMLVIGICLGAGISHWRLKAGLDRDMRAWPPVDPSGIREDVAEDRRQTVDGLDRQIRRGGRP